MANGKSSSCTSPATQQHRQLLINLRPNSKVSNLPQQHVNRARDLFHLLKIDLLHFVAGTVIVLVLAIKKEDNGNALLGVVVMIAAEEKAITICRVVVAIIESQVQIFFVYRFCQ